MIQFIFNSIVKIKSFYFNQDAENAINRDIIDLEIAAEDDKNFDLFKKKMLIIQEVKYDSSCGESLHQIINYRRILNLIKISSENDAIKILSFLLNYIKKEEIYDYTSILANFGIQSLINYKNEKDASAKENHHQIFKIIYEEIFNLKTSPGFNQSIERINESFSNISKNDISFIEFSKRLEEILSIVPASHDNNHRFTQKILDLPSFSSLRI